MQFLLMMIVVAGTQQTGWVNSGPVEEEAVLTRALAIRAKAVEDATGIPFDAMPAADIGYVSGSDVAAEYDPMTCVITFPHALWYRLNVDLKMSLSVAAPEVVAAQEYFQRTADHELGHVLIDQVARRNGMPSWLTIERFLAMSRPMQLGHNALSEGMATWVEYRLHPVDPDAFGPGSFPATFEQQRGYTFRMVAFDGGYWIVRDALENRGEEAIVWFTRHPLTLTDDNMRMMAVEYRDRSLRSLVPR